MADPGFLGSILPGGVAAYGYDQLMGDLRDQRGDTAQGVADLQSGVDQRTTFQPWGVTSGMGQTTGGPSGVDMQLSQTGQGIQDQMFGQGQDMMGRASQDPAARESEIYNRMRAMQKPGEDRQYNSMNANMFGGGRGGMSTAGYGGTPEQHAFGLAQGEARNQAALGAMGQTQNELMNQYTMGSGMMNQGYMPAAQQMQQAGLGLNNAQLNQQGQHEGANLWAQLGLGGMTAETNYSNIGGNAFGNMIGAATGAASGLGSYLDQGSLGGFFDSIFK